MKSNAYLNRRIVLFLVSLFLLFQCSWNGNNGADSENSEWTLVWMDDFDATTLNTQEWNYETGGHGWGNNELQYYTSGTRNAFTDSGFLVIEARKEIYEGSQYTSARLTTKNKGDWKYGKFEIRAQLPEGQGIWPAIWMMPTMSVYGGWPASGEIDIMELIGHRPSTIHGTIHYGNDYADHQFYGGETELAADKKFSDDFHVFSIEWKPGEIRWYLDGIVYFVAREWYTANADFPAPFDQYFFLILNVAVGGNWPGYPDETTIFPQRMIVDYVKVYTFTGYQ